MAKEILLPENIQLKTEIIMWKFEKQFREEKPETIGETDKHFDLDNYKDWLENKLEKIYNKKELTFDNINELGFVYNYFEGYSYNHEKGFFISVYDVNEILYKGEKYKCKTFDDFYELLEKLSIER